MEAHEEEVACLEEEVHEARAGGDRARVVEAYKVPVVVGGCGVREAGVGRGVQGRVEVLELQGQGSP